VALCIPTPDALTRYTIEQIADKDVPSGKEHVLVNAEDVPSEPQEAWVLDLDTGVISVDSTKLLQAKREQASLSRMAFMLALEEAGLYDAAEAAVESDKVSKAGKIMWRNASVFNRTDETLTSFAEQLGYTDAQLDALFGIN
jgi:exosome complex RNA-binding protein Rrp42 (RNase PH superfamily)